MKRSQARHKMCPYCNASLALMVDTCSSCKKKVGKIGKHGLAEKPPNYVSYVLCLATWVGLYLYMRWAFF